MLCGCREGSHPPPRREASGGTGLCSPRPRTPAPGPQEISLSFKPQPVEACCGGRKSTVGTHSPAWGSHRAASKARQRWTHTVACPGAALRSLPWTRFSNTLSMVPRLTRGPAGPSRLRSKPKAECPPCRRAYAPSQVSQGLQTGEAAARLPPAPVLRLHCGVKWGAQPLTAVMVPGRVSRGQQEGARAVSVGQNLHHPPARLPATVAPLRACRHPGS